MKKIAILMLHLKHGGIEKQTITMANSLCDKYDIEIISLYNFNNFIAYDLDSRIKVRYLLPYGSNKKELKEAIMSRNLKNMFKQAIHSFKVILNKNKAMKKYIKASDSDILFSTRIEFANLISKYNKKDILTVTQEHNHINNEKYGEKVRKSFKKINYVIVMSDIAKKLYNKWLDGIAVTIKVIPNILDHIPNERTNLNNNRLIAVGRLHPVKNFQTLIDVFKLINDKNKDITLTICGDGEEREILESKIKLLGLQDRVELTGMISAKEVESKMLNSDLYLMTSISECFPMVLLEANSCGVPVISFSVDAGPKSIIKDGKNGSLIINNNIQAMADKVLEYMENDSKKKQMSEFSREYSKKFLAENILKDWIDVFK